MSNQTLSNIFFASYERLQLRTIELLNNEDYVFQAFFGGHIVAHEHLHEIQEKDFNQSVISFLNEEIVHTPHLVLHALNHAKQINIYYREDCGFWEDLPDPTLAEAVKDVFGSIIRSSVAHQADNFLAHRSFHEKLAGQIRVEIEAEEIAMTPVTPETQTQTQTQETMLYPIFKGLSLKNADRVQKDGYLLYVGSRNSCVRAVNQCQKGTTKPNSKDGRSWKFLLTLEDFNSTSSTLTFNFKQFAIDAVESYKAKNEPKQESPCCSLPSKPNPPTTYSDDLLEEITTC